MIITKVRNTDFARLRASEESAFEMHGWTVERLSWSEIYLCNLSEPGEECRPRPGQAQEPFGVSNESPYYGL